MKFKKEDYVNFEKEKITGYPYAKKKVSLAIKEFNIRNINSAEAANRTVSLYISPYGMQFQLAADYCEGDLLKIEVSIPGYWRRKRDFINYTRVNTPRSFAVIAKVIQKKQGGPHKKKHTFAVETLSMDQTDERVLRGFLEEGGVSRASAATTSCAS